MDANLQILKSSNSHITISSYHHISTSLPHLWYTIYLSHGIVVHAARQYFCNVQTIKLLDL